VQPTFEIAEEDGHRFNALLIGQVLEPVFLNLVSGHVILALLLGLQVELLEFVIREGKKISKFCCHASP
jgi:hypothetical protein